MDHRAALRGLLEGEYPEHVCQFEWGYWPETVARWQSEGMPADQSPWEAAGITCYDRVPANVRFCPPFETEVLRETENTKIIRDHDGITKEVFKDNTAFPHFLKHPVETRADFDAIRPHLEASAPGRYPEDWKECVARLARRNHVLVMGKVEISFFGWHRDLMGLENLLFAYFEQPALIHAISEQHLRVSEGDVRAHPRGSGIRLHLHVGRHELQERPAHLPEDGAGVHAAVLPRVHLLGQGLRRL